MKKYALALDLKNDPVLIDEYIRHHENVWPEVVQSIRDSGILMMEIFHVGNRLFMFIETEDDFSFGKKAEMEKDNIKVMEWELLMDRYQQRLPFASGNEKWVLMKRIFRQ